MESWGKPTLSASLSCRLGARNEDLREEDDYHDYGPASRLTFPLGQRAPEALSTAAGRTKSTIALPGKLF